GFWSASETAIDGRNLFAAEPSKQQERQTLWLRIQLSRLHIRPTTPNKFSAPSPVTPVHSAQLCRNTISAFIGLPAAFCATRPIVESLARSTMPSSTTLLSS